MLSIDSLEHLVWIVGSSIVYLACRWGAANIISNLRLDYFGVQVTWMGRRGMRWGELINCI